jgi:hypothetical protein
LENRGIDCRIRAKIEMVKGILRRIRIPWGFFMEKSEK